MLITKVGTTFWRIVSIDTTASGGDDRTLSCSGTVEHDEVN
jgi:hypothetical protein